MAVNVKAKGNEKNTQTSKPISNKTEVEQVTTAPNVDRLLWFVTLILLVVAITGNYLLNKYYADVFQNSMYALLKGAGVVILVALALLVARFTNLGRNVVTFAKESYIEVRRVVWPTGTEARTTTVLVGVVTFVVAFMLWIFDHIFIYLINLFIG